MSNALDTEYKPFTRKQRVFVEEYIQCWNGVESARRAGYKEVMVTPTQLLQKPHIKAAIEQKLKESAIKSDEVLKRLAQQATLNIADFYDDTPDGPMINWQRVRDKGYLVKSIEYDRRGNCVLKFHDAQNALIHLGKHMKLFSDQLDVNILSLVKGYAEVSPDDWDQASAPALEP